MKFISRGLSTFLAIALFFTVVPPAILLADETTIDSHVVFAQGGKQSGTPNLYAFPARFYDADLARWLTPDQFVQWDDPQTLSPYSYVRHNPISIIDPTGQWFWTLIAAIVAIAKVATAVSIVTGTASLIATASGHEQAAARFAKISRISSWIGLPAAGENRWAVTAAFVMSGLATEASRLELRATALGTPLQPTTAILIASDHVATSAAVMTAIYLSLGVGARVVIPFIQEMPALRLFAARYGPTLGEDTIMAGRRLSPFRFTQEGEEYLRWEGGPNTRVTANGGLRPQTYVAPTSETIVPSSTVSSRYYLPRPELPRNRLIYGIRPPPGTPIIGPRPVANGYGIEAEFPFGSPPGTVQGGTADIYTEPLQ